MKVVDNTTKIVDGTTRKCHGCPEKIMYTASYGWHHTERSHWLDQPHKANPKKYKRANNIETGQEVTG